MTESIRRDGEYANPYEGTQPTSSQGAHPNPYEGAQPNAHQAAQPHPAEGTQPHHALGARPGPGPYQGAHEDTWQQVPAHGSSPVNPEWPPPPPFPPTVASGAAQPAPGPKRRTRGPLALLAAVAIVAAAIGGATAYGIQELTGTDTTAASTATNVVPSSKKGDIAAIASAVSPSIVEINAATNSGRSTGSGVIITSGGEIVTNNHVIAGASSVTVRTSDGKQYTAQVVGTDSKKDLALIKVQGASGLKAASLGDSSRLQVGDTVVAIGSPEGLTGTVTSGIVSALDRDVTVPTEEGQQQQQGGGWPFEFGGRQFNGDTGSSTTTYKAIQTDASLNPGNSGGALIDMNGNIVGINSAMYSAAGSSSSSDAGSVGLGFAIPVNTVKADLAKLRAGANG